MGGCTLSFLDREMDDGGGCTLHLLNARLTTLLHERIDRSGRQIRVHSFIEKAKSGAASSFSL